MIGNFSGGFIQVRLDDIRPAQAAVVPRVQVPKVTDSHRYDQTQIVWLDDIGQGDQSNVGTKAAGVGELLELGIPVPPGFVLTAAVYRQFLRATGLDRLIADTLAQLNPEDTRQLHARSEQLQHQITRRRIDARVQEAILEAYQELRLRRDGGMQVAVRPSIPPTAGTGREALGHHTTHLNISGNHALITAIKAVWASLFTPRAIYFRAVAGQDHLQPAAILIQRMVEADVAGVLTTSDAGSGDRSRMTIEAAWGLGQAVVRGLVTPDRYSIEKSSGRVVERSVATQVWKLGRDRLTGQLRHLPVAGEAQRLPKLADDQLSELVALGQTIEQHFQFPQNTEWAISKGQLYFVQATPLPRLTRKLTVNAPKVEVPHQRPLLLGTGVTVGVASGPVRVIHTTDDLATVRAGDVLVAELASPDFLPAMSKVAALVTDTGGRTSHAAILSHEFGIPVIVGTGNATHLLHEGQTVTVDGTSGRVYRGRVEQGVRSKEYGDKPLLRTSYSVLPKVRTATKLMVNLAIPQKAAEVAKLNVDGVGLIRAEFMIAALGEHPKAIIESGRTQEYITKLADSLEQFARAFHPHPVVYRASDFKTNEYRALKGGQQYEPHEENPMLGFRGTARYLADPPLFQAELAALKEVRAHRGWDNVQLMLPFVRTVPELRRAKEYVAEAGLSAERTFKLRMMLEVPSNVLLIDEFLDEGIDGVSIGSNDLTQLILGVDRESVTLKDSFNEMDPAVLKAIQIVMTACRKHHVPVSVCGQAASTYPEFAEFLIKEGVTTLSVDPSSVDSVRQLIVSVEHHLDHH